VATSLVARADDAVAQADQFFKQGRHAADRGDYTQACALFDESFKLDPAVGTLINLGDCAEHLRDLERAYGYYQLALARLPEGDDRLPHVHERIENIDQHAAKVALRLDGASPTDAVITVDGKTVDPLKTPVHLAAGAHVILVTGVGHRGARYNISVTDGEIRALTVSPGAELEAVLPTSESSHVRPRAGWMKPTGVVVLGVGLASVWVASLAGLMAIDQRDVQQANCGGQGCNQMGVDAAHAGSGWAATSTAMFIAGGALLAGGGVLLAIAFASPPQKPQPAAALVLGPTGVAVEGRF
jgi:hypothetical protein